MPIKVTCGECETSLTVSDAAAGKVLKCKVCGGRVKVPAAGAPARSPKPAAPRPPRDTYDPDNPLGGLDLNRAEDQNRRVCPSCANPVRVDEVECPKCGVTIATGTLSERQRIRRERKGPPPEEFYGAIWKNGWKFLKNHWGYGVRTALIWSATLSLSVTSLYMLQWYIAARTLELEESAAAERNNIEIVGPTLIITVPKDGKVRYDDKLYTLEGTVYLDAPHIAAVKSPPAYFWFSMVIVFQLGFGGWAWTLATKIAELTMAGEKRIKRFDTDFFGNLAMGFRFYFWPVIVMLPFVILGLAPAILGGPIVAGIFILAIFLTPMMLFLPAAVVHMSQNYKYRSWLIYWMVRDLFKTLVPSLYIGVLNFFLVLLVPTILFVIAILMGGRIMARVIELEASVLDYLAKNVVDFGEGNLRVLFYEMPLVFSSSFLVLMIICTLMAFPAVFMMRVIGLYGLYFKPDLSIVNEFPDFEPAGFGPRFLAHLIDNSMVSVISTVIGTILGTIVSLFMVYVGAPAAGPAAGLAIQGLAAIAFPLYYYGKGESGAARATLGKWSIGLIVLNEDNTPMTFGKAVSRTLSAFLTSLTFNIGFLTCIFRQDRKAMHDLMSKTKVVWRGEEN